jgi:flavin reductase (DIM6/NTAB) family NADH-FMN oxidoreductase RutF
MKFLDTQQLPDYKVYSGTEEIGRIQDFYFDDDIFYVRYFVVDTGSFLRRKLALVSPICFKKIDKKQKKIYISLTKSEIENSPEFKENKPLSKQYEKAYSSHFSWPYYWGHAAYAWDVGPFGIPWISINSLDAHPPKAKLNEKEMEKIEKNNLRSAKELRSYSIQGLDDDFGHVQGFIINLETFAMDFIIVDTINYLPSKLVLIRPEWVESISWHSKGVRFPFTKETIKDSPAYSEAFYEKGIVEVTDKHFSESLSHYARLNNTNKLGIKERRSKLLSIANTKKVLETMSDGTIVVTSKDPKTKKTNSFVAKWAKQSKSDPVEIKICIDKHKPGIKGLFGKKPYCLNVVSNFNESEPFEDVQTTQLSNGRIVIDKADSTLVCKTKKVSNPGDFFIVTAEVTDGFLVSKNFKKTNHLRDGLTI